MTKDILEMTKGMQLEVAQRFTNFLLTALKSLSSLAEKALARSRQSEDINTVKLSAVGRPPFVSPKGLPQDLQLSREQKLLDVSDESPQPRPR
ncbi:MAG: hypothetical protein H0U71_02975 [Gammaproteobacteria bacterium]|nr:hypothetical protein [Gammaproteobacteria bacterium]